jgi:DNA-binding NtrC family response regulator
LEILLVADSEAAAHALSTTLQRSGHRVVTATSLAGTIETLMRRGPFFDVIITSTRFDSSLGEDAIQYSRKFAAHAQLIVLHSITGDAEDVERALARQSIPDRLQTMRGWN